MPPVPRLKPMMRSTVVDMAEAPQAERVLEVGQLLAELVQVPVRVRCRGRRSATHRDRLARRYGCVQSRSRCEAGTAKPRRASSRRLSS